MFDTEYLKSQNVLFIEQEELIREKINKILSKLFKNVITVSNGLEALEKFQDSDITTEKIDLIISNIDMPIMNGIEMLEKIREFDNSIPIIFVANNTDSNMLLKAINLNVSNFITNPINTNNLIEKISETCEKKYFKKQLVEKQNELEKYIEAVDHVALIYKMDDNGDITFGNTSLLETSLYTLEELKTLNLNDLIHPDIPKEYIKKTWEIIRNGDIWNGNTKFLTKEKEVFYLKNTIFKIQSNSKNEYITIGFLTTQENIEKREFHKKVLQTFQELHKKEYSYKKLISKLSEEVKQLESYIPRLHKELEEQKTKALNKHRQLEHYEMQMHNVDEKYHDHMNSKTKEADDCARTLFLMKQEKIALIEKYKEAQSEIEATKKELKLLMETNEQKNKKIADLNDVIKTLETKIKDLKHPTNIDKK